MDPTGRLLTLAVCSLMPSCRVSLPPSDPVGHVVGTIRSSNNLPLEGAAATSLANNVLLDVTDSTGTYTLPLPPGTAVISYGMPGVTKRIDSVTVVLGETTAHDVVLPTLPPAHLTVILTDESARPIPSAFIVIFVDGSGSLQRTDAHGMLHHVVRPGSVRVRAWRAGDADRPVWDSLSVEASERVTVSLQVKDVLHESARQ
jgi:hypothetical protein